MNSHHAWIFAIALASAGIGVAAGDLLDVRIADRPPAAVSVPVDAPEATLDVPRTLPMRLVDAGGVGITPDSAAWAQGGYSHGAGAFHALIRPGDAGIDAAALARTGGDWRTYIDRVSTWGANGVVVPAFLELIDFRRAGAPVYTGGDAYYLERHAALRRGYAELFRYAAAAGMDVYLKTDMLVLTPPLERALRNAAGGLDAASPALWEVYAAGLDELFDELPEVGGVVVRIGEAGALYNAEGWEYRSEMAVRTPAELQLMLRSLLPVFERHGRRLVLRSWTVGVGPLGTLHTDPAVYDEVLGDIRSPALIVSTKYGRGDYFSHLPLNPTLHGGAHPRLIEFQARREFEGFGAFANFLGAEHGDALRAHLDRNANIAGISLWTQEGGPVHASPISLYPVHGFWRWIDANVYATTRLAMDPSAEPAQLAADWVRETVSTDSAVVEGLTRILLRSHEAVEKALYVRPFAEREVRALGVESTPLMWIMEWDVIGDWSLVSSAVYRASRGRIAETIAEGFNAVEDSRAMRAELERIAPRLSGDPELARMRRSLLFQESLFTTLAWWRATLLQHYHWLNTGDAAAHDAATVAGVRFEEAARAHGAEFGRDLDFPAWDFAPALAGLTRARRSDDARSGARVTLVLFVPLLLAGMPLLRRRGASARLGRSLWIGAAVPWRLPSESPAQVWGIGLAALVLTGLAVTFLLSFEAHRVTCGSLVLLSTFAVVVKGNWTGLARARTDAHALAILGPLIPAGLLALVGVAVHGPDGMWFLFWTHDTFRVLAVAVTASAVLLVLRAAHVAGRELRNMTDRHALAGLLLAAGATLIAFSLLLPDLPTLLASLDDPLAILPVRTALIVAVTSYVGVSESVLWIPAVLGGVLMVTGAGLRRSGSPPPADQRERIVATRPLEE